MTQDHDHHDHHHSPPVGSSLPFAVGVGLNLAFVVVEIVFGVMSHSLALVADAGHNFGDVLGLGLSWGAMALATLKPSTRRTFGFRRATIIASAINAAILLFVTGGLTWEAIQRLLLPQPASGKTMIAVALVGAVVNAVSALLFMRDRKSDLNLQAAFAHLAGDAALAVGVAIAGGLILATGKVWLDPAVSIGLAIAIVAGTWSLLRKSVNLLLDAVPDGVDPEDVKKFLESLPAVIEVHDLHIWAMSTTETALTAHLVMPRNSCAPTFLANVCKDLRHKYRIDHSTLQLDPDDAPRPCTLAADEVV